MMQNDTRYLTITCTQLKNMCKLSTALKSYALTAICMATLSSFVEATPVNVMSWNVDTGDKTFLTGTDNITVPNAYTLTKTGTGLGVITNSQTTIDDGATVDVSEGTLQINNLASLGGTTDANSGAQVILQDGVTFAVGGEITVPNKIQIGSGASTGAAIITGVSYGTDGTTLLNPATVSLSGTITQGGTSTTSVTVGLAGDTARAFTFLANDLDSVPMTVAYGTVSFNNTTNPGTLTLTGGATNFTNGAVIPSSIVLSGGRLNNNGNTFTGATLVLTDTKTSIFDVNNNNVVISGFGTNSSGDLKIFDSQGASTKTVDVNGANADLTGTVTLFNGVTINGYEFPTLTAPENDHTTLTLPYNNGEYNLLTNAYLHTTETNHTSNTGLVTYIGGALLDEDNGSVTTGADILYTPAATFHGSDTLTYQLADTRYRSDTGTIETPGVVSYPLSSGDKTVTIVIAPPSDLNGADITLTDADFTNFGDNLTSFPTGAGAASTFTNSSLTTDSTLTINLTANRALGSTLTHTADKHNLNLSVTGNQTLTLAANNTYVGSTNIGAGATLIGDIHTSSAVTIAGTYDLNGSDRTIKDVTGDGTIKSSTTSKTVTFDLENSSTFTGIFDNTLAGIVKTGATGLTINSSSLTVPLSVTAGSLVLEHSVTPGTAALTFSDGTTFQAKGLTVLTNPITFG